MHKVKLSHLFLLTMVIPLWYTFDFGIKWYSDSRLDTHTHHFTVQWTPVRHSEEDFHLEARYHFTTDSKANIEGVYLDQMSFLNVWAAEYAIPRYLSEYPEVWYDSKNPKYSTLKKSFPLKECLSSVVLWGLFLYFIGLKKYVKKYSYRVTT